jgi:hypothetical protein
MDVGALVTRPADRVTPELAKLFPELPKTILGLPLPQARPVTARPSFEDLVRSDTQLD